MFKPVPPQEGKAPTELPRVEPRQATFFRPEDLAKMHLTKWSRVWLWIKFFAGFLDRFVYEDDEVILSGFRDPDYGIVYLTRIEEKR